MTVEKRQNIKFWSSIGISTSTLIYLMTLSFNVAEVKTEMKKDIEKNKIDLVKHQNDLNVHMPFSKKVEVFVPRIELDNRLKSIESKNDEILSEIREMRKNK